MKRKPPTVAKLRKKLWGLMSIHIRSSAGDGTFGNCYTCDKTICLKYETDVGHFYNKGSFEALRFDTRNLRIQCKGCNLFKQGNVIEYERRLRNEIGQDELDDMHRMRNDIIKRGRAWYIDEIEKYKQLIDELEYVI